MYNVCDGARWYGISGKSAKDIRNGERKGENSGLEKDEPRTKIGASGERQGGEIIRRPIEASDVTSEDLRP